MTELESLIPNFSQLRFLPCVCDCYLLLLLYLLEMRVSFFSFIRRQNCALEMCCVRRAS